MFLICSLSVPGAGPFPIKKGHSLRQKGPRWHDGTRTRDLQLGRLALYPAELRAATLVRFETKNSARFGRQFSEKRLLRRFHFSFTANPNRNLAVRWQFVLSAQYGGRG